MEKGEWTERGKGRWVTVEKIKNKVETIAQPELKAISKFS